MLDRDEAIKRVEEMPIEELRALVKKCADEVGVPVDELLATDWSAFFEKLRRHEI